MNEKEFEHWYERAKEEVNEYESTAYRTSVIAGLFGRSSRELFTGEQVNKMLALRYQEKERVPM